VGACGSRLGAGGATVVGFPGEPLLAGGVALAGSELGPGSAAGGLNSALEAALQPSSASTPAPHQHAFRPVDR